MRAHALVLLLILGLVAPARPVVGVGETADAGWEQGHQLVRRGAYADAQQVYADLADQFVSPMATNGLGPTVSPPDCCPTRWMSTHGAFVVVPSEHLAGHPKMP